MKTPGKMASEVLRSIFRRPATTTYPAEKAVIPDKFRGKIKFIAAKCVGCKMCMRDCPTACITITKVEESRAPSGDDDRLEAHGVSHCSDLSKKRFQAAFDLDKCIYCAQCADSCPKDALESTPEFELAQLQRAKLKVVFHAEPPPAGEAGLPAKSPEQ